MLTASRDSGERGGSKSTPESAVHTSFRILLPACPLRVYLSNVRAVREMTRFSQSTARIFLLPVSFSRRVFPEMASWAKRGHLYVHFGFVSRFFVVLLISVDVVIFLCSLWLLRAFASDAVSRRVFAP